MRGTFQVKVRLGPELYPRIARRQQRTAPFSEFRGGRPCLDLAKFQFINFHTHYFMISCNQKSSEN